MTALRVLILEDSEDDEELLLRELKRAGYDVTHKRVDTEGAMRDALRTETWDIVFSDYAMPEFSGMGAVRVLKESNLDVPIILVSGTIGEDVAVTAMKAGVHDYIMKGNLARLVPALQRELREADVRRERRRSELALQESELRFRQMAENIRDVFWLRDPIHGRAIYISPMYEEIWGRSCASLYERPLSFMDAVHPDDRAQLSAAMQRQIAGEHTKVEYRVIRPDGTVRWVWDREFPIIDASGKVYRIAGIAEDITGQKQLLEREQAARAEAERVNAMKDEFLAVLSHELRTPLTPVLGWIKLIAKGGLDELEVAHAIEVVERNLYAELRLIEDLLDVSRVLTGKLRLDLKPTKACALVESVIENMAPAAGRRSVNLELAAAVRDIEIVADPARLQQVISNLLSNAIKFTRPDGRITLRILRAGERLTIEVIDDGEGLDPAFLPRVFHRFAQADSTLTRRHGGLGIGLSLVRHLTELHGGSVSAHSPGVGKGSTFTVTLPLNVPRHVSVPPETTGAVSLSGLRLLLVEDDADTREFITRALKHFGAEVSSAPSALDGFNLLQQAVPDVLISDIQMPGEDGFKFIERVRRFEQERGTAIPAVALTAYAKDEDRTRVLAAGFQMYVAKPVEPEKLASAVAHAARKT